MIFYTIMVSLKNKFWIHLTNLYIFQILNRMMFTSPHKPPFIHDIEVRITEDRPLCLPLYELKFNGQDYIQHYVCLGTQGFLFGDDLLDRYGVILYLQVGYVYFIRMAYTLIAINLSNTKMAECYKLIHCISYLKQNSKTKNFP